MAIDNRLEKALDFYSQETEQDIPKKALKLAIELIPHFGNHISKLVFGDAQRRIAERAQDVFEAVKERVERMDEAKIDKEFFKSDEFMTLLFLALDQIQTTHDKEKLGMLANAITNSGVFEFSTDSRKELFMRIFRDLAPEHIQMLQRMRRKPINRTYEHTPMAKEMKDPHGNELATLQSLAAHGLVEEYQAKDRPSISVGVHSSEREAKKAMEELIMDLPKRCFRVNRFGEDFLRFFDDLEDSVSKRHACDTASTNDA